MRILGTRERGADPVLAVLEPVWPMRLGASRVHYPARRGYGRHRGHKATATPTPMETARSRVTVRPMRKRRMVERVGPSILFSES